MSEDEQQVDASNQQEDADLDTAGEETIESLKAERDAALSAKQKADEIAENQRIRAEKAEGKKGDKPQPKQQAAPAAEYDLEDVAVLVSKVTVKEDRDFVKRSAKLLGITLEEALNDPVVSGKLKEFSEQRQTAKATNTGSSRRTSNQLNDEQIVQRFMEGKEVDPEALAVARMNLRKKK